ncbi:MAG: hypothetical protein ABSE20_09670 [Acetobacteraceae bacterium]|jgi:hypothetical protein
MALSHFIGVAGPDPVVTFSVVPREIAGSGAGHDGSGDTAMMGAAAWP